jgi:hypothetical protein
LAIAWEIEASKQGFIAAVTIEHPTSSGTPAYRAGPSKAWLKIKNPSAPGVLRFKEEAEP